VNGFAALLAAQLAGEIVARGLRLPIPGPVIGMVLVLVALACRASFAVVLEPVAFALLEHLSLLFVPAGVGVMRYGALLQTHGIAIAVAIVVSTALGMATTAVVLVALERRREVVA
jgi:holin-like protein